jgi:uncharacterized protein (DUF2141 family)
MNWNIVMLFCTFFAGTITPETEKIRYQDNYNSDGIQLIITNIRNKEGLIRVGVFYSNKGYPDRPRHSFSQVKDTISSGELRLFIPVKEPCSVGFSILDDENGNGKMDYFLGIIPKEGFGFSNNPKITSRKAPPFNEVLINFTGGKKEVKVNMKYI